MTDITGSEKATRGIFYVYDVFGLFIQTLMGADIMAYDYKQYPDSAGDYKIFMPDFFGDNPSKIENFPPKSERQRKEIMAFITGPADPSKSVPLVEPLLEAFQNANPQITSWAIVGFCWGVKIGTLCTTKGTKFSAAGGAHPSLMDVEDAKHVAVPTCILPSQDEDPEVSGPLHSFPNCSFRE